MWVETFQGNQKVCVENLDSTEAKVWCCVLQINGYSVGNWFFVRRMLLRMYEKWCTTYLRKFWEFCGSYHCIRNCSNQSHQSVHCSANQNTEMKVSTSFLPSISKDHHFVDVWIGNKGSPNIFTALALAPFHFLLTKFSALPHREPHETGHWNVVFYEPLFSKHKAFKKEGIKPAVMNASFCIWMRVKLHLFHLDKSPLNYHERYCFLFPFSALLGCVLVGVCCVCVNTARIYIKTY